MRLVQVVVPDEHRDAVLDALDDEGVDYVVLDEETRPDASIVQFPLPVGAVEPVLEALRGAGADVDRYTVVSDLHTATTPNLPALEDAYIERPGRPTLVSHTELRTTAQEFVPDLVTYVGLVLLSAVVATAGLLLDSAIIITGSMVLAPFLGVLLSAAVGAVIDDRELALTSVRRQLLGYAAAVAGSIAASAVLRWTDVVSSQRVITQVGQVSSFSSPNLLVLAVAVAAGIAGALAVATDVPAALAGVAVAAAIVPSAATVGVGLSWGHGALAISAFVLLVINVVFINLAALGTLFALGYDPRVIHSVRRDLSISIHTTAYTALAVLTVVAVVFTVVVTYQYVAFDLAVNRGVEEVLSRPAYDDLGFVRAEADYYGVQLLGGESSVTVVIARTGDRRYPQLAGALQRELRHRRGQKVQVRVRFVDYQVPSNGTLDRRGRVLATASREP